MKFLFILGLFLRCVDSFCTYKGNKICEGAVTKEMKTMLQAVTKEMKTMLQVWGQTFGI